MAEKTLHELFANKHIVDTPLFGTGPEETDKEPEDPEKFQRIQTNLQRLNQAGASVSDIEDYLTNEGESMFRDPTYTPGKDPVTLRGLSNTVARGATKGTMLLGQVPALAVDMMDTALKQATHISASLLHGDGFNIKDLPQFEGQLSKLQAQGTEELNNLLFGEQINPEQQHFIERAVGQTSEFVAPGSLITYGMTKAGAKLIASAPQSATFFQRMFMDAARNPAKAQALEFGYSTTAAVTGEAAVTFADSGGAGTTMKNAEWVRLGAELGSVVPTLLMQNLVRGLLRVNKAKLALGEEHVREAAKLEVGKYFSTLMEIDPQIARNFDEALALSQQTGVQFNTAQAAQNPNIQKAMELLASTHDSASTQFLTLQRAANKRTEQFADGLAPIIRESDPKNIQPNLRRYADRELGKIDKRIERTLQKAADDVLALTPGRDAREAGESAIKQLDTLRDEAFDKAELLYDRLDNSIEFPIKWIQDGIRKAGISKKAFKAGQAAKEQGRTAGSPLVRKEPFGGIADSLLDTAARNFGEGTNKASLLAIREWRQEVNKFLYEARKFGDDDTAFRLKHMLDGVDKQLQVAANKNLRGNSGKLLKEANKFYTDVNDKFDRSLAAAVFQKDVMGRRTFAPEDFARHFIRPGSRKEIFEAADSFHQLFGDTEISRKFIQDGFAVQLQRKLDDMGGEINERTLKALASLTNRHKDSLQRHGVWDRFNSVNKISDRVRQAVSTGKVDRQQFEDAIFNQALGFARTTDPHGYLLRQLKSGNLGTLRAQVEKAGAPALRSYRRKVWNLIMEQGEGNVISRNADKDIIRKPEEFNTILTRNKDDIIGALGKDHYESLETIGEVWRRQFVKPRSGVVNQAYGDDLGRVARFSQRQLGRALSKIRASLQGFVSPQFTALQLANQAFDLINSGVAHEVFLEALLDPQMAKRLASMASKNSEKEMLRMIGVAAAIPATTQAIAEDDPRFTED